MFNTISARQIQREYKKVFEKANKIGEPIIAIANNKPLGAVIGLDLLEKLRMDEAVREALEEYKKGEVISIKTKKQLEDHFKELKREALKNLEKFLLESQEHIFHLKKSLKKCILIRK